MGDVFLHGFADDPTFCLVPAHSCRRKVVLKPQKRADRHADVVPLGSGRSGLVNPTTLLQPSVIVLDRPTQFGILQSGDFVHGQVIGRPVRNVTVWGDNLEDQDQTETLQVDGGTRHRDYRLAHRSLALTVEIDKAVRLQSSEPEPAMTTYRFQIF
jgi:hypothetical protein